MMRKYKHILSKQIHHHSMSPLSLQWKIVFFFLCCATIKFLNASWLVLLTGINQEQQHCLMDCPPPSIFLLCRYIIWLSGLSFKCRSINLPVSAWCLRLIFGTKLCQRRTNPDDSCRLPVMSRSGQAQLGRRMVDSWIASWAAGWVEGWPGKEL